MIHHHPVPSRYLEQEMSQDTPIRLGRWWECPILIHGMVPHLSVLWAVPSLPPNSTQNDLVDSQFTNSLPLSKKILTMFSKLCHHFQKIHKMIQLTLFTNSLPLFQKDRNCVSKVLSSFSDDFHISRPH